MQKIVNMIHDLITIKTQFVAMRNNYEALQRVSTTPDEFEPLIHKCEDTIDTLATLIDDVAHAFIRRPR